MGKITQSFSILVCPALVCLRVDSGAAGAQTRPVLPAAPAVHAGTRYADAAHHFSLVVPPGWTVNKELIPHYAVFVEPNKSAQDEAATIGTYGEPVKNLTLDQYIQATKKGNTTQKGLTVYEEKAITLGGLPAHECRMRVSLPGHATHENRQAFGVRGNQAIILTLTALPGAVKNYDAVFDAMLASFRWEGGKSEGPAKLNTKANADKPARKSAPGAAKGALQTNSQDKE